MCRGSVVVIVHWNAGCQNCRNFLICCAIVYATVASTAERHDQFDPPSEMSRDAQGLEQIIVLAEREDSAESERRVYMDHRKALYLYARGKYEEALPLLLTAAKHGYKDSQARLAHLYLHGLGGVRRSDKSGIAWMGVAAHGETTPIIQRRYEELLGAVPPMHMDSLKRLVEQFVQKYGNFEQTVQCEVAKHSSTMISKTRCYFEYEFAVLSPLEIEDMQKYYEDKIIPPDQYSSFSGLDNFTTPIEMPPVRRSE